MLADPKNLPVKAANALFKASQQGGQSMAATHYVLMKRDRDYREKYKEFEKNESQNRAVNQ